MQRERRRLIRLAIPPAVLLGADYVIGASRLCTSGGGHVVHARVQKVRGGMTTAGWRATFYTTGMEHSPTRATGTGHTRWSVEAWTQVRVEFRRALAPSFQLARAPQSYPVFSGYHPGHSPYSRLRS